MSRSSKFARQIRVLSAAAATLAALTLLSSCSDHLVAPSSDEGLSAADSLGIYVVISQVPDALKNPPPPPAGIVLARSQGVSSSAMASLSAGAFSPAAAGAYTVSSIEFAPEPAATASRGASCDDCVMFNVPIGFNFSFFGNTYSKIHISSNGFVGFSPNMSEGCCSGAVIPLNDGSSRNNLIAFAWSDWVPAAGIRYEIRGTAPSRRFVLQYNASEYGNVGSLSAQVILYEGSNDITMYSTSMRAAGRTHFVTQGIENASGTEAHYVTGRVRSAFTLANDAVRFSATVMNQPPVVTAPANLSVAMGAALCAAVVDPGIATVVDETPGITASGKRSDALALDAAYPKGITTITWTATDAEGLMATASQTVTVSDNEHPTVSAPANISADNTPGLATAAVVVGTAVAVDNCPNVTVAGRRSDGAALSAPYPVGLTTITWKASDESGNSAAATQTVMVRDVGAPSISVADTTVDAVAPNGAAVSFVTSASDNVGVAGISCTHASGSIFPIGSTSVTCTAWDAVGNRSSRTFMVSVRGASAQIAALIEFVEGLGLHNGTANPMLNQLRHALSDAESANLDGACKKMNDFIRMAAGKKGAETGRAVAEGRGQLSGPEVAKMLTDARRILNVLGGEAAAERNPPPSFKVM